MLNQTMAASSATTARAARRRKPVQLVLPVPKKSGRGGARKGAGRKPKNPNPNARANVPHRRRPDHAARCPVHVTLRAAKGVPSLRAELVKNLLKKALKDQSQRDYGVGFQVVHFSIQEDHLHLTVEAKGASAQDIAANPRLVSQRAKRGLETKDRDMLRRGIAGLSISFARSLNRLLGRKGKVWADRHHRRDLATPTEVRNTLLYVLQNYIRHGAQVFSVGATDPLSTAPSFDGWAEPHATSDETEPWRPRPRTWLLGRGWLRAGGPLSTLEAPPVSPNVKRARYVPVRDPRDVGDVVRELTAPHEMR